ncbi:unnamed protein product [Thlaspi arvense]|uniref:Uncharacterized protein n=1 Tax=Thlaspi arvense TaxID=13288 RepID=A0AAU9RPJ0_THLAR|nr:unnamed protein product [Thlaspi arvense]
MKRKRGHKKGNKSKKPKLVIENAEKETSEQSSGAPAECENSEHESKIEVDAPSSTGSGNSPNASVDPAASDTAAKSVVGRVKVKLKSSKAPEPDDIDKSGPPQAEPEKPAIVAVEKKEEPFPVPVPRKPVFLNVYRKTKGIKIKSLKPVDGSSSVAAEKSVDVAVDAAKAAPEDANVVEKDTKTTNESPQVKKIEPESAPVSSQDEQKKKTDQDSRYSKQELEDSLKVIKKIMKMEAADPFNVPVNPEALGIPPEALVKVQLFVMLNLAFENSQLEDGGKASSKGKQKSHKRHGKHHKSDCMCAICVLKRRKRERQGSQGHSGAQEESSPVGSPSVDNSSINMGEEQDMDVDTDSKTGQGKSETVELDSPVAKRQRVSESKEEVEEEEEEEEKEGKEEEEENVEELQELERKRWRAKIHEKFQLRNPQVLSLCEIIFPNNNNSSVWNGPHSLFKGRGGSNRSSSLHKAVEALMKL